MFRKGEEYDLVKGSGWNPFKRRYKLLKNYSFEFMGAWYYIDAGYEWDGPTGVPILKYITSGWLEPSLRHDWLYEHHFTLTRTHFFTQEDVDEKFVYDLGQNGVGWATRFVIEKFYRRVFGRFWKAEEAVKISFPLIRDIFFAVIFTIAFAFFLFKAQGMLTGLFLGLFGA